MFCKIIIFLLTINTASATVLSKNYNLKINNIKNLDFDIIDQDSIKESLIDKINYPKNKTRVLVNLLPIVDKNASQEAIISAQKATQEILIDGQEYTESKYPIDKNMIINVYYDGETKEMRLPNVDKIKNILAKKYQKYNILEFDIAGSGSSILIDTEKLQNSEKFVKFLLDVGEKFYRINMDFLICKSHLFNTIKLFVKKYNVSNKIINVNLFEGWIYLEHYYIIISDADQQIIATKYKNIKTPTVIKYKDIPQDIKDIIVKQNAVDGRKFRIMFNRLVLVNAETRQNFLEKIECDNGSICSVFKEDIKKYATRFF